MILRQELSSDVAQPGFERRQTAGKNIARLHSWMVLAGKKQTRRLLVCLKKSASPMTAVAVSSSTRTVT